MNDGFDGQDVGRSSHGGPGPHRRTSSHSGAKKAPSKRAVFIHVDAGDGSTAWIDLDVVSRTVSSAQSGPGGSKKRPQGRVSGGGGGRSGGAHA